MCIPFYVRRFSCVLYVTYFGATALDSSHPRWHRTDVFGFSMLQQTPAFKRNYQDTIAIFKSCFDLSLHRLQNPVFTVNLRKNVGQQTFTLHPT